MAHLREDVLRYIRKHALLGPGDRIAAACSGGADSVALFRLLLELREELGLVLLLAHFNHQLRGPESDEDERFVQALAEAHGVQFHVERGDVAAAAKASKESIETAARAARYGFFDQLLKNEADKVALAHTMNDQAETVLMRLLRGAGGLGLAAMSASREMAAISAQTTRGKAYIRPLLGTLRHDIEGYLRGLKQSWCEDSTNQETAYTRNRIRHHLIPALRDYNPRVIETLSHTAEVARAEEYYWDSELKRILPAVLLPGTPTRGGGRSAGASTKDDQCIAVGIEALQRLPLAMQRRVIRHMAESLDKTIDFEHTSQILDDLLSGRAGSQLQISSGFTARRTYREIILGRQEEQAEDYEYVLPVPGEVTVNALKTRFIAKIEPVKTEINGYNRPNNGPLPGVVKVRNWQPGDRARLAYSKREKKVKEILQDLHVSGALRQLWPVIEVSGRIVWIRNCELEPLTDGLTEIRFEETATQ